MTSVHDAAMRCLCDEARLISAQHDYANVHLRVISVKKKKDPGLICLLKAWNVGETRVFAASLTHCRVRPGMRLPQMTPSWRVGHFESQITGHRAKSGNKVMIGKKRLAEWYWGYLILKKLSKKVVKEYAKAIMIRRPRFP